MNYQDYGSLSQAVTAGTVSLGWLSSLVFVVCLKWNTKYFEDVRMSVDTGGGKSNHLKWPKAINKQAQ